ncbi:MAG TPA: response regulator transcription factor [Gemmataceae bacterium]|nr:response regulator transcription factor [Gemmataceae bacterium]
MKILIAEDNSVSRRLLQAALAEWGYEVVAAADGSQAWDVLRRPDAPRLAILDWMMPGLAGVEVCRRLREQATDEPTYVILLTSRDAKADVVRGLQSGANDYVTKPFDRDELQARVRVGQTVVALQQALAARVRELEAALAQVKQLRGLLPICSYCKKVRDDCNYWQQVETYISHHADVQFSHGICPECMRSVVEPELRKLGLPTSGPPAPE